MKYTKHCIRAACITTLDVKGVEVRHIMGTGGHKSENSIRTYSSRLGDDKKKDKFPTYCVETWHHFL